MKPVLELSKLPDRSFCYSIRAPRAGGVIPPASYAEGGMTSLAACLQDAAHALGSNFSRVYVRYQGVCVGELDLPDVRRQPGQVAEKLLGEYRRRHAPVKAAEAA